MPDIEVDHLHIKSADSARSAAFYVDALGAREVSRTAIEERTRIVLDIAGLALFIEDRAEDAARKIDPPFTGLEHIAFRVSDLEGLAEKLRTMGIRFAMQPKQIRPGIIAAFIYGPDGEYIELIERQGG